MSLPGLFPAIFFDRDGTLMEEVHYCGDPAQVRVYPCVSDGLRKLKQAGFRTIIVSNQSGIGRGLITDAQYRTVQAELLAQIGEGLIDACYYCPDAPPNHSICRKPEPGMLLEAVRDQQIDLTRSYMVGDKAADIECGQRAGVKTILVATGYGAQQQCDPHYRVAGVVEAMDLILMILPSLGNQTA